MSTMWIGWSTDESGLIFPGQLTRAGTRVPPSYSIPLLSQYQGLGQEPLVRRETVGAGGGNDHRLQAITMRIAPRHERGPRRRAQGLSIELLEPDSAFCQLVDARRGDVRAVEADILPAEVIRQDVDDVRTGRNLLSGSGLRGAPEPARQ